MKIRYRRYFKIGVILALLILPLLGMAGCLPGVGGGQGFNFTDLLSNPWIEALIIFVIVYWALKKK